MCEEKATGEAEWPVDLVTRKLSDGEKGETGQEVEKTCG